MNKSLVLKKKLYLFSFLVFSFTLFLYLSYFLFNAERGVIAFYKIKNQETLYDNELASLIKINNELEDKISRLSPQSLDLDYLEEQLLIKSGSVSKNELLVILEK